MLKGMRIFVISLLVICSFITIATSSAFAEETAQWLVDGSTIALGEKLNVVGTGELLMEDMNATLKPDILCTEVTGLGWIYSNGEGEAVEGQCGKFESMTSGVTCEKVEPIDLPWLVQLVEMSSGVYLGLGTSDGKGEPGWRLECVALGVKITDVCTNEHATTIITNDTSTEEVEAEAPETDENADEAASCVLGGKEEGLLVGTGRGTVIINGVLLALAVSLTPVVG